MNKLLLLSTLIFSLAGPAFAWPTVFKTGTTLYDPDQAFNGYVLYAPMGRNQESGRSRFNLINMNGKVLHSWTFEYGALKAHLMPSGNLLAVVQSKDKPPGRPGFGELWMGGAAGLLIERTWDNKKVFEHHDPNMHHDGIKLPNGHYLYLAWEPVPPALQRKVRGGVKGTEFPGKLMFNDYLVEVNKEGKVIWKWHANDHLDPERDIIGPVYHREEWLHANSLSLLSNGNIVLTSRNTDSLIVIDRKTSRIVSRFGSPSYIDKKTGHIEYRPAEPGVLGGPHAAMEIPNGYPGAGNLICYDNGLYTFASRAAEINPRSGKSVLRAPELVHGRKDFSDLMGSAQRLPNGNNFICEGGNGRFYQETPDHVRVWEYINPYVTDSATEGAVIQAQLYPPSYCPQFTDLSSAAGSAVVPSDDLAVMANPGRPRDRDKPVQNSDSFASIVGVIALAALLAFAAWKAFAQNGTVKNK